MKINYKLINYALSLVPKYSKIYNIDESHSLRHSLDVFHNAKAIYQSEEYMKPFLKQQQNEIFCSAIIHDLCDSKYTDKESSLDMLEADLSQFINKDEWSNIKKIISTMSYSYVKQNGFPQLHNFNLAYNIVREADLLAAYDVERCFVYKLNHESTFNYISAFQDVEELFNKRVFKYIEDDLYVTEYSKKQALILHQNAKDRLGEIKQGL